ncbi:hypothetical protein AB1Y20_009651 [Prymnesium parvum]|uniref:DNA 3'-5' helicase n=1 Tax=Prymnesium parvum TaxID=97485 RepID=A0AB34K6I3_PRYPA
MSSALISTKVLPARLRLLFPFEHFNPVQSECFDITFNSDTTLVVASPTGSGKTGVLELALARMWASNNERTLALYVAPLKALVTERFNDWTKKTNELGLRVVALTGDDENDVANERAVAAADLILTTPEKWDSFTRFRRDAQGLLGRCGLLLLDEIHLLHERTRGPTLEAMVSRMLSISGHMKAQGHHIPISREAAHCACTAKPTIIGVSATIQNVHDIACWLSVNGTLASEARLFDASYRPVPLRWIVQSIPMKGVVFKYDATLCEHLHAVIRQYSDGRPTLVFCNSTKTAERAAGVVAQASRGELLAGRPAAMRTQLTQAARSIRNTHLASLLPSGTAFHVSTLVTEDRQTVEQLFLHGALPVLCCTSGLAQGLNLPARLVVIMNTSIYTPGTGGYEEYTRIEVLQAAGRAGRPQFDDVGVCVLMTRPETSSRYESLLSGSETIESHMDDKDSLTTHLNAEIAAGYLQTLEAATAWLKSTFLFVRMKRNPAQYNLPRGLSEAELEKRLSKICMRDLEKLAESEMIQLHADGGLQTLPIGTVMARHYLDFKTAASFREIRSNYGIEELLDVISMAAEFQRALYLRTADKRPLFEINSKMVRFPVKETVADKKRKQPAAPDEAYGMQGEPPTTTRIARCKTTATKANLLLQLKAGGLPMQEFHYADWILSQNGKRILRALVDHLENVQMFNPLHKALLLQRSLSASVGWHDDPASGVRQLSGIGIVLLEKLREGLGGDVSLHTLSALHPARLEHICSKSHPWGQNTLQKVRSILASALSLSYRIESAGVSGEVRVTICAICAPAHTLLRHGGDHSSPAVPPVLSLSETRSFDRASVERLQGDSHVEPGRQAAPSVETPLSIQKESPSRPSPPTCDFFLGLEHPLLASIAHTSHKEQLARAGKARHLDFQEGESSPAARALSAPVIRNPLPKCGHSTEPRLEAGPSLARAMPTMSIARAGLAQGTGPDGEIHLCTAIDEWLSSAACGGNQKRKASPPAAAEPQRSMLHPPIPKPLTKTKAFSFLGQC